MLEVITKLVEQVSSTELSKSGLGTDLVSSVSGETGSAIFEGLKNSISSGNIGGLTSLLSGQVGNIAANPIVGEIIGNLTGGLTSKLGLSPDIASNFSGDVVPKIIETIVAKIQSGESGFQLNDIIGSLGSGGIQDLIGSFTDGKEGLGGILDKFKGLF